jgi:hypothetical protein
MSDCSTKLAHNSKAPDPAAFSHDASNELVKKADANAAESLNSYGASAGSIGTGGDGKDFLGIFADLRSATMPVGCR